MSEMTSTTILSTAALPQAERIYVHLRRAIMRCELLPGVRLKVMEIAEAEEVSPGAVREALSRLTTEHLVDSLHQRGFRVAKLSREDMLDLFDTRAALERELCARSVRNQDAAWKSKLETAFMMLVQDSASSKIEVRRSEVHETFHRTLASGCGSPWSMRLFETIYAASERYRHYAFRQLTHDRNVDDEHGEIYAAAVRGDADLVSDLISKHTLLTRNLLSDALGKPIGLEARDS